MPPYLPWNVGVAASPTAAPVIFEPPSALTHGRHEVWVAAGGGEHWGGCEIWVSINDQSYRRVGLLYNGSAVGTIAELLAAAADPDTTSSVLVDVQPTNGVMFPGSRSDADMLVTLCWVDGELIAPTEVVLTAPHVYRLSGYIRRGCFGTPITNHQPGAAFAQLSLEVWRFEYPPNFVGAPVYLKFPAFNEFSAAMETLDVCPAYSLTLTGISAQ